MFNLIQLVLLAAIWGSSFLFMRIAAGEVQPLWIAEGRVFLAALFLAATGFYLGRRLHWQRTARANCARILLWTSRPAPACLSPPTTARTPPRKS